MPLLHTTTASSALVNAPLTLIVLNPDGTPAVDAVAVYRVAEGLTDGVHTRTAYTATPNASGALKVQVPLTDPYIASHAATSPSRLFDVHVDLFTFSDPVTKKVSAYNAVNYVMNLDGAALSLDFAALDNSVVELVPVPAKAPGATDATAGLARDPLPNVDNCTPEPQPGVSECVRITHPPEVQGERVVMAHNVGAGIDFETVYGIMGTVTTGTTTVSGVDGLFVESKGHHSLSESATDYWTWRNGGISSANEDAALYTNFAKVYTRSCWATGCTETTEFVPDDVVGAAALMPTSEPIYHDYAHDPGPTDTDCTTYVDDTYTNTRGSNKQEEWTFGFDFEGQYEVFTLHATSVTQRQVDEQTYTSYTWRVASHSRPHHHVFVPFGHASTGADAASICPTDAPGSVWTDADWRDKSNPVRPPPAPSQAPEPVKEPVDDGEKKVGRCYEAPERCGKE